MSTEIDDRVGLCGSCAAARRVVSAKGSEFWRCTHPELPKYPQLPVRLCAAHTPIATDEPDGAA